MHDGNALRAGADHSSRRRSEILEFIAPEVHELGNEREIAHIERIMREGTGADRQLAAWEIRHEVKDVVDQIVGETYESLEIDQEKGPATYCGV